MNENTKYVASIALVLILAGTALFSMPVNGLDQGKERVESISYPDSTWTLTGVAWEKESSHPFGYALAVGHDNSNGGLIKRFNAADQSWDNILAGANRNFFDVVQDEKNPQNFFACGQSYRSGSDEALLYQIRNAGDSGYVLNYISSARSVAEVFKGITFDQSIGSEGGIVIAGNDSAGVLAYYNIGSGSWTTKSTGYAVFESVAKVSDGEVFAVGHHGSSAVFYDWKYGEGSDPASVSVPSDAAKFYDIASDGYGGRAIIAGVDKFGHGKLWEVKNNETGIHFNELKIDSDLPALRGIDVYQESGSYFGIAVGESGTILLIYHLWSGAPPKIVNWSSASYGGDLYAVAIKAPHSPGYGLGVGAASSSKISYQVADSSTQIEVNTVYPHINEIDLRDSSDNSVLDPNQQLDVGSTYHFFVNGSYSEGWEKIQIDIYGWYDFGSESQQYNQTKGGNLNFHLRYLPDSSDPYNNSGTWTLMWPKNETEIGGWQMDWVDNPTPNGTTGSRDKQDFYLVSCEIRFGPQVRMADANGAGWHTATDRTMPSGAFNDAYSWNFNVSLTDRNNDAGQTQYDEFGIYSYTEISTSGQNPTGSGPPGSTITLTDAEIYVSSNRQYYVTANVTDLTSPSGNSIPRNRIDVINWHPDATSSYTDISAWTAFSSNDALWVWGVSSTPTYMDPLDFGIYSAGPFRYGNTTDSMNTDHALTVIGWRIRVPTNTPEDHFTATITYAVTYP